MLKPESVLGHRTHKILWDFEIQTNHHSRPEVQLTKKENLLHPGGSQRKNQRKRKERQICAKKQKKKKKKKKRGLQNMRVTVILIVIDALGKVQKDLESGLEELEIGGRIETIFTTALSK